MNTEAHGRRPKRRFFSRLFMPAESADSNAPRKAPHPSVLFLVLLNGLAFFALGGVGNHLPGVLFFGLVTVFYLILSAIPQLLVRFVVERRAYLRPLPRALAYLSPLPLLFLVGAVMPKAPRPPNKLNPTLSSDGVYEARFASPNEGWEIVLTDQRARTKTKIETEFVPHLQIYWHWDDANRLWIYNSDDGSVHFAAFTDGEWRLRRWGYGHQRSAGSPSDFDPPAQLYPPYATRE